MRFKQRLKVIQSLEDTAKKSVVCDSQIEWATKWHIHGKCFAVSIEKLRAVADQVLMNEWLNEMFLMEGDKKHL